MLRVKDQKKTKKHLYKTARVPSEQYGFVSLLEFDGESRFLVRKISGETCWMDESELTDFCL